MLFPGLDIVIGYSLPSKPTPLSNRNENQVTRIIKICRRYHPSVHRYAIARTRPRIMVVVVNHPKRHLLILSHHKGGMCRDVRVPDVLECMQRENRTLTSNAIDFASTVEHHNFMPRGYPGRGSWVS